MAARKTEEIIENIIDSHTRVARDLGFDPTLIRIYIHIFLADDPLTVKDITKKSGYSTTLVSTAMPILEKNFDIDRFKKPGSKTRFYSCRHSLKEIQKRKLSHLEQTLKREMENLKKFESELSEHNDAKAIQFASKLAKARIEMMEIHKTIRSYTP